MANYLPQNMFTLTEAETQTHGMSVVISFNIRSMIFTLSEDQDFKCLADH